MKSGRRFGMLRKVCAVAVASVLAAGCLTACGSSKNTGPLTLDQIKENGKLTVATEAAYEPFEYMDGDKIIGYNADLFAKICDDLGWSLIISTCRSKEYLQDLKQRNMTLLEQHLA